MILLPPKLPFTLGRRKEEMAAAVKIIKVKRNSIRTKTKIAVCGFLPRTTFSELSVASAKFCLKFTKKEKSRSGNRTHTKHCADHHQTKTEQNEELWGQCVRSCLACVTTKDTK